MELDGSLCLGTGTCIKVLMGPKGKSTTKIRGARSKSEVKDLEITRIQGSRKIRLLYFGENFSLLMSSFFMGIMKDF